MIHRVQFRNPHFSEIAEKLAYRSKIFGLLCDGLVVEIVDPTKGDLSEAERLRSGVRVDGKTYVPGRAQKLKPGRPAVTRNWSELQNAISVTYRKGEEQVFDTLGNLNIPPGANLDNKCVQRWR